MKRRRYLDLPDDHPVVQRAVEQQLEALEDEAHSRDRDEERLVARYRGEGRWRDA